MTWVPNRRGPNARSGRNKGVFDFNITVDVERTVRGLNSVNAAHQKAKIMAATEAGESALAKASSALARKARVSLWQIRGTGVTQKPGGQKNTGARVGRSRYVKKIDGVKLYLRHTHINPIGTNKRQNTVEVKAATLTKTGKIRKNSASVKVRTTNGVHNYQNGYIKKGPYQGAVYKRVGGAEQRQDIDIGQYNALFEETARNQYAKKFGPRWQKHFNFFKRKAIAGSKDRAVRRSFARSLRRR